MTLRTILSWMLLLLASTFRYQNTRVPVSVSEFWFFSSSMIAGSYTQTRISPENIVCISVKVNPMTTCTGLANSIKRNILYFHKLEEFSDQFNTQSTAWNSGIFEYCCEFSNFWFAITFMIRLINLSRIYSNGWRLGYTLFTQNDLWKGVESESWPYLQYKFDSPFHSLNSICSDSSEIQALVYWVSKWLGIQFVCSPNTEMAKSRHG